MLFSLKDLSSKLSPSAGAEGLHTVKMNTFTLHHFESFTGMMFVLNTAPEVQGELQFFCDDVRLPSGRISTYPQICSIFYERYVSGTPVHLHTPLRGLRRQEPTL